MRKLALFDIDKTLIRSSKAHIRAFSEAFKEVYGVNTGIDIIDHHGMIDQQIIIEVLQKRGLDDETIHSKLEKCMKVMTDSFNKVIDSDDVDVLSGVRELLEELGKHSILMGLVTGNLEPIAFGKLRKVNLDSFFKIGGFGNESINRTDLVKLAIEKAKNKFDLRIDNNVFLFGDTPRDMIAGKEAGIKTIGVTTGVYSRLQLENAGADFVLKSLEDTNEVLKIIL